MKCSLAVCNIGLHLFNPNEVHMPTTRVGMGVGGGCMVTILKEEILKKCAHSVSSYQLQHIKSVDFEASDASMPYSFITLTKRF